MSYSTIIAGGLCFLVTWVAAPAVPRVTSLANPDVHYTLPEKAYVILRRGEVEAVVVDNRAVNDAVLPRHAAGYHGIAAIRHVRQPRNLFVPSYAGLNFEHIHDGTVQSREVLFEPRQVPMELRVIDEHAAELYQRPTPYWGTQSPSGGGSACPAWDFQWFIPAPQVDALYQLTMRAAYVSLDRPDDPASVREQILHGQK